MVLDFVTEAPCDNSAENAVTNDLMARQVALEERARERGIERFNAKMEKAAKKLQGAETEAGLFLIKKSIEPVVAAFEKFVADAYSGKPGVKHTAAKVLKDIDHHLAAYCTMSQLVGALAVQRSRALSSIATSVGKRIELELKMAAFDQQKPGLYRTIMTRLEDTGATNIHKERVVTYTANKFGVEWEGWTPTDKLHLGAALINLAIEATGIAGIKTIKTGKNQQTSMIYPTPEIIAWLRDRNEKLSVIRPVMMPMIVPPRDWKGVRGGGYRTDVILKTTLVKRAAKAHNEALKTASMGTCLTGLNAIQRSAWAVNERVLDVAQYLWDRNLPTPGLPSKCDEPLPPTPLDIETNEEARTNWKRQARTIHENNIAARTRRIAAAEAMTAARELVDEAAIYFPHQLDFRGRCYSRASGLSPQGTGFAKGLLHAARGKALGTERAAGWLAIHGANTFGVDKVSHEARIDWVYENAERIRAVAADPIDATWWHEAEEPWCFLAFCFEWARFAEEGLAFVSRLPIAMDGSCNGIQHYSAMLLDPVGGAAVNLTPSEKPQDIYGKVAEECIRRLKEIANSDDEKAWVAMSWLSFGIDRKTTKRQVMVLPYGGTQSSCREYTIQAAREKIAGGAENPFGDELAVHASWLGGIIWNSIGDVVVAARSAMTYLREVAKVVTKAGHPLLWTTPSGFMARQDYREVKQRRIKTRLGESLIYFTHNEDTKKLDTTRQGSGIAPNFVHSLDAAAMMLTIEMAEANHLDFFAMIHDSYGTLAADTDVLATCLREAFVDMYTDNDMLQQFTDEVTKELTPEQKEKLPALPPKGSLDLSLVLSSPFFFT